jgi:uncharacterized protein YnzC (UPF0291/DUF896 family)
MTALEDSKRSKEQLVSDIDAYKVLFKSEVGANAAEIKVIAAALREKYLSRVRKRARENLDSNSELI